MAQAAINIRMDADLKQSFEKLCDDLGMNMTTAITIFAKKSVREHRIPFEVCMDPFYSERNMARLGAAIDRLDAGLGKEHELIEADDEENMG